MRKMKTIRKVVVGFVLTGALIIPLHTPIANMVPGVSSITMESKAEAKAVMSKKQAKKKLKKWIKRNGKWENGLRLEYDRTEGYDYIFHAYFDEGDHTSTQNWYHVNCRTGKISAEF